MTSTGIRSHRDLTVWQRAIDLTVEVYRVGSLLPSSERFGLKSQMERAAASIASNIAEGHGRHHLGDYLHHLSISEGSLAEVDTCLVLCTRLAYLPESDLKTCYDLLAEVRRMLYALEKALRRRKPARPPLTPDT